MNATAFWSVGEGMYYKLGQPAEQQDPQIRKPNNRKKPQSYFRPNPPPNVKKADELHLYSCKQVQQTRMLWLKTALPELRAFTWADENCVRQCLSPSHFPLPFVSQPFSSWTAGKDTCKMFGSSLWLWNHRWSDLSLIAPRIFKLKPTH